MCWNCRDSNGRPHVGNRRRTAKAVLRQSVPVKPQTLEEEIQEHIKSHRYGIEDLGAEVAKKILESLELK